MSDTTITQKTPHYCYHCGNRLLKKSENCWYCGAPVHREIRSVRRCPFCAEPIRPEAVKCRHCGEFLDGRPRVEQRPIQQMVVIDKDVLKTMSDMRLFPGLPVPEPARNVLDTKTVEAIEKNRPEEIEHPGVHLLPAPSGSPILVDETPSREGPAPLAKRKQEAEPRPPVKGKRLPVMPLSRPPGREKQPPAKRRPGPLAPIQPKSPGEAPAPEAQTDDATDAAISDAFRTCANCGTEILATDNFCYHCGTQYRRTQVDKLRAAKERRRRVVKAIKLLAVLLLLAGAAALAYVYFGSEKIESAKQKVLEGTKGAIGAGMEKLGLVDKKAVADAERCRANLAAIQKAKLAAAKIAGQKTGPIDLKLVLSELGSEELPKCPSGGTYSINEIQQPATCSIGDNGTPTKLDDHILSNDGVDAARSPNER